jgi:hypothetical protein
MAGMSIATVLLLVFAIPAFVTLTVRTDVARAVSARTIEWTTLALWRD